MTFLFDSEIYLLKKGHYFNLLGIELLSLNRFLTGYLDSSEPYPPSSAFLQAVKEDINPAQFPQYTARDLTSDEDFDIKLVDSKELESMLHEIETASLGMGSLCSVAQKKTVDIRHLITGAITCFLVGKAFKILSLAAGKYDNYLPTVEQLIAAIEPPTGATKVEISSINHLDRNDAEFLANLEKFFEATNEFSIILLNFANRELGYWRRWIAEIRGHQRRTASSGKTKAYKKAENKQQTCELFFKIGNRTELNDHKLALEIRSRWVLKGEKDTVPSKRNIIRYLREANLR